MSARNFHQAGNEKPKVLFHGEHIVVDHEMHAAALACDCFVSNWQGTHIYKPDGSEPALPGRLKFVNALEDTLAKIFWISYERGRHVPYGTLRPGECMDISTQTMHSWSVETCDSPIEVSENNIIRGGYDRFAIWHMWEQQSEEVLLINRRCGHQIIHVPSPKGLENELRIMGAQHVVPYFVENGNLPTPEEELLPVEPEDEPVPDSDATHPDVRMVIINARDKPVHLYWRNHIRQRVLIGIVPPGGARVTLRTYSGHPWLITDDQRRVLGIWCPHDSDCFVMLMDDD